MYAMLFAVLLLSRNKPYVFDRNTILFIATEDRIFSLHKLLSGLRYRVD